VCLFGLAYVYLHVLISVYEQQMAGVVYLHVLIRVYEQQMAGVVYFNM